MKNFRMIGMALLAGMLSLSFVACNKDDGTIVLHAEIVTVDLGITGEYIDLSESPLETRAGQKKDLIAVQVYTIDNTGSSLYAWGHFHSMDGVSIKLLENKKFKFVVEIITDCCDCFNEPMCNMIMGSGVDFNYSSNYNGMTNWGDYKVEKFYGELDSYSPVQNGVVEIATKRVNYGAHYIAEGLTEGRLDIEVSSRAWEGGTSYLYIVELTPAQPEDDNIYTFYNMRDAWFGRYKTADDLVDYYMEKRLAIRWNKADGSVIPLGDYEVTFRRNVRTTIRIKVEEPGVQNGIVITREEVPMVADENEYVIEGGKVTEVPIRQN